MSRPSSVVTLFENGDAIKSSYAVKAGIAQMLRGGVVMEVSCPQQAKIAEEAGAIAVSVVADGDQEVSRMVDPDLIRSIKKATILPVISKARIGHFVEAQVLEHLGVDFIDESESLTCADDVNFINKHNFSVPFISGCSNLGETLRRMAEGASIIRTQGRYHYHDDVEADTDCCDTYNGGKNGLTRKGNIMHSVQQIRSIFGDARRLQSFEREELHSFAKKIRAPYELLKLTKQLGRLPIMVFAYGGLVTPADAAMAMQLGCDGIFLDSDIFQAPDPLRKAMAFVQAVTSYNDSQLLAELMTADYNFEEVLKNRLPIVNQRKTPADQRKDIENAYDQRGIPSPDGGRPNEGNVQSVNQTGEPSNVDQQEVPVQNKHPTNEGKDNGKLGEMPTMETGESSSSKEHSETFEGVLSASESVQVPEEQRNEDQEGFTVTETDEKM